MDIIGHKAEESEIKGLSNKGDIHFPTRGHRNEVYRDVPNVLPFLLRPQRVAFREEVELESIVQMMQRDLVEEID